MRAQKLRMLLLVGVLFEAAYAYPLLAESSHDAWLRYAPIAETAREKYAALPAAVVVLGDSLALGTAQGELIRGVRGMLEKTCAPKKIGLGRKPLSWVRSNRFRPWCLLFIFTVP